MMREDSLETNDAVNLVLFLLILTLVKAIFLFLQPNRMNRRDNENFSEIGQAARMQIVAGGAGWDGSVRAG